MSRQSPGTWEKSILAEPREEGTASGDKGGEDAERDQILQGWHHHENRAGTSETI